MPTPCIHCQHPLNTPGVCTNCKSTQSELTPPNANPGGTGKIVRSIPTIATNTTSTFQVTAQSPRSSGAQLQIQQQLQARSRLASLQPRQIRIAAPRVLNRNSSRPRLNQVRLANSSASQQVSQQVQQQLRQRLRVQNVVSPQGPTRYRLIPKCDPEQRLSETQDAKQAASAQGDVFVEGSSSGSPIRIISSPSSAHISSPVTTAVVQAANSCSSSSSSNNNNNRVTRLITTVDSAANHSVEQSQQLVKVVEPVVSAVVSPTTPPVSPQYEIAVSNGQTPPLYKILYPIPPRPAITGFSSNQLTPLTVNNSQIVSSVLVTPSGTFQVLRHATAPSAQTQQNNANFKQITHQSLSIMSPPTARLLRSKGSPSVLRPMAIEPPPVVTIDDEDAISNEPEEEEKAYSSGNGQEIIHLDYYRMTIVRPPGLAGNKGVFRIRAGHIRVGTFLLKDRFVTFSRNNLQIIARPIDSSQEVRLTFNYNDIIKTIWALTADTPGILFNFSPNCGPRIRKELNMKDDEAVKNRQCDDSKHPYFEPSSTIERQRRIIIILGQPLTAEEYGHIQNCYMSPKGGVKKEFAEKLLDLTRPNIDTDETPIFSEGGENCLLEGSNKNDEPGTSSTLKMDVKNQRMCGNSLAKVVSSSEIVSILKSSWTKGSPTPSTLPKDVVFTNDSPMCQYPPSGKGSIVIRAPDFLTLLPDKSVNDAVIDFYLSYIIGELIPKERADKVFAFNTFFYSSLIKDPLAAGNPEGTRLSAKRKLHDNVKRWTKGVDLFTKDFILIPVCEHSHWFLIMVCFPWLVPIKRGINLDQINAELEDRLEGKAPTTEKPLVPTSGSSEVPQAEVFLPNSDHTVPPSSQKLSEGKAAIYIFDSLRGNVQASRLYPLIRDYLAEEFLVKKKIACPFDYYSMRGYYPNAPQQTNFHDCGIFVLEYAKQFLLNPPTIHTMGTANSFSKMFNPDSIMEKGRWEVAEVMLQLSEKQFPELKGVPRLKYEKLIKVEGKTYADEANTPPPKRTRIVHTPK